MAAFSTEAAPTVVHIDHDDPKYGCLGNFRPTNADARDAQQVWRIAELQNVDEREMAPCE